MIEYEALFNTFRGLKPRQKPYVKRYAYDVIGRLAGIVFTMFMILILMSFLAFALKPFNITITQVVEYFWRDYTFILAIPLSIPSVWGTINKIKENKDAIFIRVCVIYFFILTLLNIGIFIFGTIPLLKLLGA